jgi:hydroxyethylthiazole kinase-like uncharacterized protein yjeF
MPLPQPGRDTDKDGRGRVLVVGGCPEVPGAALLAGVSALRAGAGRLQIATAASIAIPLGLALPEARVFALPERAADAGAFLVPRARACKAVLIGPGILDEDAAAALARVLLSGVDGPPFVLDAAAVTALRDLEHPLRRQRGRIVVTPHAGEMAVLLGIERRAVAADPLGAARQAAARLQAIVVMKGGATHVVAPQGEAWLFTGGHVGLATSGSGDTLAGIVAGLLARGASPVQAALWGVFLHGEAGNRLACAQGPLGYLARDIPAQIPRILAEFARS